MVACVHNSHICWSSCDIRLEMCYMMDELRVPLRVVVVRAREGQSVPRVAEDEQQTFEASAENGPGGRLLRNSARALPMDCCWTWVIQAVRSSPVICSEGHCTWHRPAPSQSDKRRENNPAEKREDWTYIIIRSNHFIQRGCIVPVHPTC
jgi:hypothetical protein